MSPRPLATNHRTPLGDLDEGEMCGLLGYRLAQAAIVSTHAFERSVGVPLGLRPVEFTILQLVKQNPQTSPAKLAHALDITQPAVKAWLDRLEARQLLQRTLRDTDRRSHRLALTAQGAQLVSSALQRLLQADTQLLQVLSAAEFGMLIELLTKVGRHQKLEAPASKQQRAAPVKKRLA